MSPSIKTEQWRKDYQELITHWKEIETLERINELLSWDQDVYMPAAAAEFRGEQGRVMAGLVHDRRTSPRFGEILARLADDSGDSSPEALIVREIRRRYERERRRPRRLVEALAELAAIARPQWIEAREKDNFSVFSGTLEHLISLRTEEAQALSDGGDLYDSWIDDFEPQMKTSEVKAMFKGLRAGLVPLVQRFSEKSARVEASFLHRRFPRQAQQVLCAIAVQTIGFDLSRGRIDETVHPFCGTAGPNDIRLTTHYFEDFINASLFGIIHEAGHGIFEQNVDPAFWGTPLGQTRSTGLHESQSRMFENVLGRNPQFWRYFYPIVQRAFPEALSDVTREKFVAAINKVEPSLIRIEADEATYNLHIIIRAEIEMAMLDGSLKVHDLPHVWNERYKSDLGVSPTSMRDGCLQDIHWSIGAFGYFPGYTLGNLYAAQIFAAMDKSLGGVSDDLAHGDFKRICEWLKKNIHRSGLIKSADIVTKATGSAPSHKPFIDYLGRKLEAIF